MPASGNASTPLPPRCCYCMCTERPSLGLATCQQNLCMHGCDKQNHQPPGNLLEKFIDKMRAGRHDTIPGQMACSVAAAQARLCASHGTSSLHLGDSALHCRLTYWLLCLRRTCEELPMMTKICSMTGRGSWQESTGPRMADVHFLRRILFQVQLELCCSDGIWQPGRLCAQLLYSPPSSVS